MSDNPKTNWRVVNSLQHALADGKHGLSEVPLCIIRIIKDECWREFVCEVMAGQLCTFESFAAFVTHPLPDGLGTDLQTLENICRDNDDALRLIRQETVQGPGGDQKSEEHREQTKNNNVIIDKPRQGNAKSYALDRLWRKRRDLYDRVETKELSCNAAMIEAGFRKVLSPLEQVRRLWGKLTPDERQDFIEWMADN